MVFADIEKIKQEYTDKYVVVDPRRPELARFRDVVGQVKTVNMNGNALVEFSDYHLNIGWYDISLDYLKVVDKPEPQEKAAEKKPAAKAPAKPAAQPAAASGEKKMSPLEMARAQGAAGKAGGGESKPSTADILAAARGGAAPAAKKEASPAEKPALADKPKLSTADILAAARGGSAPEAKTESPQPEPAAAPEPEPTPEAPAAEAAPAESKPVAGKVDRNAMSVEEMLAYCREHDAG